MVKRQNQRKHNGIVLWTPTYCRFLFPTQIEYQDVRPFVFFEPRTEPSQRSLLKVRHSVVPSRSFLFVCTHFLVLGFYRSEKLWGESTFDYFR